MLKIVAACVLQPRNARRSTRSEEAFEDFGCLLFNDVLSIYFGTRAGMFAVWWTTMELALPVRIHSWSEAGCILTPNTRRFAPKAGIPHSRILVSLAFIDLSMYGIIVRLDTNRMCKMPPLDRWYRYS